MREREAERMLVTPVLHRMSVGSATRLNPRILVDKVLMVARF